MSLLAALFCVVGFALLLHALRLVAHTRDAIAVARTSAAAIGDAALSDREKETLIQRNTLRLFRLLGILVAGSAVCLLLPLAVIWLADRVGWVSLDHVLALFLRVDFLVGGTVLAVATYLAVTRWRRQPS